VAGQSGERERLDEFLRAAGHYDLHVMAVLLKRPNQLGGFISRDSAAYP
jgi:hypothetical protein